MPRTHLKRVFYIFLVGMTLLQTAWAQEETEPASVGLILYIQELEQKFGVRFSFVDEDLRTIEINRPDETDLQEILEDIRQQTQLIIRKLDDRYFTIAQSSLVDLCGQVLDNFESANVGGATIEVLDSDVATVTDMNGVFRLNNIPRGAILRIRHLGFKTRFLQARDLVYDGECEPIVLAVNYQQLQEVVVYQLLTTGLTKQLDGSVELLPDDYGILPGLIEPDVLQTVQALPGIKSIDETVSNINIRGGSNDQNLILWDGIKMYQSGHFFGLISAFNPFLTDKVVLIKNGTSAEYGDGVSGIISMQTNDTIRENAYGGAGMNLISGDAYGHIPLRSDLAVQFSARRSVTDFLNTPTYDQFFDRAFQDTQVSTGDNTNTDRPISRDERFYFYDFTGKVLYDYDDSHQLRLSGIHINNTLDYTEVQDSTAQQNVSRLDQANWSFGGKLNSQWTDRFRTDLSGYYTKYQLDSRNSINNDAQELFQSNEVFETALKLNTYFNLSDAFLWLNGYQFSEVGITNFTEVTQPPFRSNVKSVIHSHAAYSEIKYSSDSRRFLAAGGLRMNFLKNLNTFDEVILEPRLNISAFLANYLRMELQGEFKNQVTNQVIDLEQNFLGIEKRRWVLSDEALLPITKSKQGSLGFNYEQESWFIGLEGFIKQVDGISTSTQGFQNEDQFNGEIGSYDVKGLEFLINYKDYYFSTWLSYAFNENNYTFDDIDPNNFPNNLDVKHALTLASTFTSGGLKIGLGLNYRSGKPFTEPQDDPNSINTSVFPNQINYKEPNSSRLPEYIRADLSAEYDFQLSRFVKASAGASVLNLLNRRNILNTYYRLNDNNEIEKVENISLGLTPNVSFRIAF